MNMDCKETCQNCGYFRQHYIIWCHRYDRINFGHCTHPPGVRHCRPETAACAKWIPQDEFYRSRYLPREK